MTALLIEQTVLRVETLLYQYNDVYDQSLRKEIIKHRKESIRYRAALRQLTATPATLAALDAYEARLPRIIALADKIIAAVDHRVSTAEISLLRHERATLRGEASTYLKRIVDVEQSELAKILALDKALNANLIFKAKVMIALILLAIILVFTWIIRSITVPVKALSLMAQQVSIGNFDVSNTIESRDELGQLGLVLNNMAVKLKDSYSILEQKNAALNDLNKELIVSKQTAVDLMQSAIDDKYKIEQIEIKLRERKNELETLLHVATHDLKEPLRMIENYSDIVLQDYSQLLDKEGQYLLHSMVEGTRKLRTLINEVLNLSQARNISLPIHPSDAQGLVEQVLERLQLSIREKNARINLVASNHPPLLFVNKLWVVHALYNLVANALKFTHGNTAPDIEIAFYEPQPGENDGVGFVVRDRGPGVKAAHAERIFELFQRAVGQEVEGSGAGLAIVREVAKRHGGWAWVKPRDGGGSEFFLTFSVERLKPPVEDAVE